MKNIIIAIFALSLLPGCVAAGSAALQDASDLHEAGRAVLREIHDKRREVRRICWEILMDDIEEFLSKGDGDGARAELRENYPPLMTIELITAILKDPASIGTKPFGCF